jgi:arylsulfatase A-like enzyme
MKTNQDKSMLNLRIHLMIASLTGLAGGLTTAVINSYIVLSASAPPQCSLHDILSVSLYPIALYSIVNALLMSIAGGILAFLFYVGGYDFDTSELIALYCGIFTALSLSLIRGSAPAVKQGLDFVSIFEGALASILYGIAAGVISLHIIRGVRKERLLPLLAVSFAAILILPPLMLWQQKKMGPSPQEHAAGPGIVNNKPNILWIVNDAMRADHLSCYGYRRKTTPCIDKIAEEGVLFTNAFSASSWTLPSMASMFSGIFPSKHGADGEHYYLDGKFTTFAEVAKSQGYRTFAYSNNPYVSRNTNLARGFDVLYHTRSGDVLEGISQQKLVREAFPLIRNFPLLDRKTDKGAFLTNMLVKKAIKSAHDANNPFFIVVDYMETHTFRGETPYHDEWFRRKISLEEALKIRGNMSWHAGIMRQSELTDEEEEDMRNLYDGDVSYLDSKIRELIEYLAQSGILDTTIVIITSDHGENLGEHHFVGHMFCIYDTLLHVPLVIRYPKAFKKNTRIEALVQTTDIFPTLLELTGIEWEGRKGLQGRSLAGDPNKGAPEYVIAELGLFIPGLNHIMSEPPNPAAYGRGKHSLDASPFANRLKAIRTETFKYIWNSNGRDELYNIHEDPGELHNIIAASPEVAEELKERLRTWLNSFEGYGGRASNRF